jgi:hypothetical protein
LISLLAAVLVQVAVEQQYQQLCEAWKAELDEKQRQFEQARAQILEPRCVVCLCVCCKGLEQGAGCNNARAPAAVAAAHLFATSCSPAACICSSAVLRWAM